MRTAVRRDMQDRRRTRARDTSWRGSVRREAAVDDSQQSGNAHRRTSPSWLKDSVPQSVVELLTTARGLFRTLAGSTSLGRATPCLSSLRSRQHTDRLAQPTTGAVA